jgi:hypothetical protein
MSFLSCALRLNYDQLHSLLIPVRLMSNVIRILLRRPLVSDGQLHSASPTVALESFRICAAAAADIVKIGRLYDRAFKIQRAPYLVSYSTYVAATIHVRIAAKRGIPSEAHECLAFCLRVFDQNSETNNAVRKAELVIRNLMARMGVEGIVDEHEQSHSVSHPQDPAALNVSSSGQEAGIPPVLIPATTGYTQPDSTYLTATDNMQDTTQDLDINAIVQSFVPGDTANNLIPSQLYAAPFRYNAPNGFNASDWFGQDLGSLQYSGRHNYAAWPEDVIFGFNTLDPYSYLNQSDIP